MINKHPPFKGLHIRIPIIIPIKGRGFINHGSTLRKKGMHFLCLCRDYTPIVPTENQISRASAKNSDSRTVHQNTHASKRGGNHVKLQTFQQTVSKTGVQDDPLNWLVVLSGDRLACHAKP